jgi:NAD(P)-dependent dehydrogenase (short-subunit alcohol dehydrogenase family)
MKPSISRRQFIQGASVVAATSVVAGCGEPGRQDIKRPPGVPVGPFGPESTAEEVTAGLDLTGQTVVITGANSGLGYETMRVLALRGAHVIGTGRTREKAETACASIDGQATPAVLELTDLASVRTCADQIRGMNIPIDMLILNAGIMSLPELEQVNGIEKQFFVNHLGHFLFANLLTERVVAAPAGRVISLSSSGHQWAPEGGIQFDNLSGERDYDPMQMYGQSKLANGLFAFELARRLGETNATSNAVHPGIINTNLGRHFPKWQLLMADLIGWAIMKPVEAGAATTAYVAASPIINGVTGYYFADCNPEVPDPRMNDEQLAGELWSVSEELTSDYMN